MNDNERVYALYVQANPVPDPDLLPLTRAEAELLTVERSPVMDIQERIPVQPAPEAPRRRSLAFGLAAVVVIAAAAAAMVLFVAGDSNEPAAAADAAPRVVFDGASCRYAGPELIETGVVDFTFVNTSSERFDLAGWRMPESGLTAELERFPLGTDMAETDQLPDGNLAFNIMIEAGSESAGPRSLAAGPHLIDCLTFDGGEHNHVWRAAAVVEVVAP
ncbi:MAG: hypothetical protein OEP52_11385 [Acidimicrobiia bacterium]|nr:hypothetical protein [Acidimicrobiia bacterium]